tara:strand:+ start:17627 stop:17941 length:315 start_codon:yes stop_codon:yes gene_type:complete
MTNSIVLQNQQLSKKSPDKIRTSQKKVRASLKLAEELSELSTVILQQINKPDVDLEKKITWGIGDVYYRLDQMTEYYDREEITIQAWSRRKRSKESLYVYTTNI